LALALAVRPEAVRAQRHMGWKIRRSYDDGVMMALDVIVALMKEARIGEVCDGGDEATKGKRRRFRREGLSS